MSENLNEMEQAISLINEGMEKAQEVSRNVDDSGTKERIRQCIANIETATNTDHQWLGGSMFNLEEIMEELCD